MVRGGMGAMKVGESGLWAMIERYCSLELLKVSIWLYVYLSKVFRMSLTRVDV